MIKSEFRGKLWFGSSGSSSNDNRRNSMQARYGRLMCLLRNVFSVFEKEPKVGQKRVSSREFVDFVGNFVWVHSFEYCYLLESVRVELSTQQMYSNDFSWWPWNGTHFGTLRDHSFVKSYWNSHKRMFETGDVCILHTIWCFLFSISRSCFVWDFQYRYNITLLIVSTAAGAQSTKWKYAVPMCVNNVYCSFSVFMRQRNIQLIFLWRAPNMQRTTSNFYF